MPLRSVEAASRDDAIAAAREQYGPSARVVGVRRVRSGGVLGFFATERYVAEVAPDPGARPMVPVPTAGRPSAESAEAMSPSPLATAAPARARTTAPARNGAAAYAAVSTPASSPAPAEPARSAAVRRAPAAEPAPRQEPAADEARLSELVGLLAAEAEPPAYSRASFPRTTTISRARALRDIPEPSFADDEDDEPRTPDRNDAPAVIASAAPSPFTAALARMVAGDRDVRQAVEEALQPPTSEPSRTEAEPGPTWAGTVRTAEPSVPSPAARQKEETVGNQVIAPPSTPTARTEEFPAWAGEPDAAAVAASSREDAIAEVLRSALAQGHSDEALSGILRKVLAGASPQTALSEPEAAVPAPPVDDVVLPNVVADVAELPFRAPAPTLLDELTVDTVVDMPVIDAAILRAPAEPPLAELLRVELPPVEPVRVELPPAQPPVRNRPAVGMFPADLPPVNLFAPSSPASGGLFPAAPVAEEPTWAERASQSTLWGEPVAAPVHSAPIWADIVQPGPATSVAVEPVEPVEPLEPVAPVEPVEPVAVQDVVAEPTAVADVEDVIKDVEPAVDDAEAVQYAVEEVAEDVAEEVIEEAVLEMAPLLARTASDPAPLSLDATTVMPPLSLLPPLPGGRGRGRPPVPPVMPRRPASSSVASSPAAAESPAAPAAATEVKAETEPEIESWTEQEAPVLVAPSTRSWATVTRLPVAPLMATPETPDMPELADALDAFDEPAFDEPAFDEPAFEVAPSPRVAAEVAPVRAAVPAARPVVRTPLAPPAEPGDVGSRLMALGVPAELLGPDFASAVAAEGTYAALTHALGLRLAEAPELPSGAGEVLFVVGPGVETLRAARSLAATLRLDPERVQWATRGDLVGLAPETSRMATIDAAIDRRQAAAGAGTVTIVAVDAPMRTDAYWMAQMLAIWSPVAVWAVVEATRKPEDLESWLDGLSRVDALIVQDTDLSADPAAVLHRVAAPVAVLDGVRATSHRWASLLCERLEGSAE